MAGAVGGALARAVFLGGRLGMIGVGNAATMAADAGQALRAACDLLT